MKKPVSNSKMPWYIKDSKRWKRHRYKSHFESRTPIKHRLKSKKHLRRFYFICVPQGEFAMATVIEEKDLSSYQPQEYTDPHGRMFKTYWEIVAWTFAMNKDEAQWDKFKDFSDWDAPVYRGLRERNVFIP